MLWRITCALQGSAGIFFLKLGQRQMDFPHKFRSVTNINAILLPKTQLHSKRKVEKSFPDTIFFFFIDLHLEIDDLFWQKVFHQKNSSPKRNTFQGQFQPRWLKFGKLTSDFYFSHHSSIIFLKNDGLCNSKGNEHSLEERSLGT